MKVELTPTPEKEKAFEPFSVTFTFETEQEACCIAHLLNLPINYVESHESKFIKHSYTRDANLKAWSAFNKIMFEKGLSTRKP